MEKIAYHTPTKQSVIDRAKKWKAEGVKVFDTYLSGEIWERYKEETCVSKDEYNVIGYCNKNYYKQEGYKIIPYEKKLEYGYCEEGDVIVDRDGDTAEIIKVTEKGLWRVSWNCKDTGHFDTWKEGAEYVKKHGWKIKQPTEDTITVKMKRSDYDTLRDIELEVVDNSK